MDSIVVLFLAVLVIAILLQAARSCFSGKKRVTDEEAQLDERVKQISLMAANLLTLKAKRSDVGSNVSLLRILIAKLKSNGGNTDETSANLRQLEEEESKAKRSVEELEAQLFRDISSLCLDQHKLTDLQRQEFEAVKIELHCSSRV